MTSSQAGLERGKESIAERARGRMKVAIHQPNYFPWLGYFYKIASADVFIFLDDAQFSKNGFINRNRIASAQGVKWLTVPVRHRLGQLINETQFADPRWGRKHVQALRASYGRSPGFADLFPPVAELLERPDWPNLAAFNVAAIQLICGFLDLPVPTPCSSALGISGQGEERLARLVRAAGGSVYLSGPGGSNYQTGKDFQTQGITLEYIAYPDFRSLGTGDARGRDALPDSWPPLSALDFLFRCGPDCGRRFASCLDVR